jgi:RNA polymerase sigma-70 factor (ECF subfamily)
VSVRVLTPATAYDSVWPVSVPDRDVNRRLDALVREHQEALYAFALKLTGEVNDARDLVQDVFEKVLRTDAAQPRGNDRAWMFTVLHHLFVDRYRKKARAPRHASLDDVDVAAETPVAPPAWVDLTVDQVRVAMRSLEPEFAEVYELHALEGLGYGEIAARLGLPSSTVGTRIMRARKKLRAILAAQVQQHSGGDA